MIGATIGLGCRAALAGFGAMQRRLSVVLFHRVLEEADPYRTGDPTREQFDAIVGWLADAFRVMTVAEASQALAESRLPARALCITFDDGYADNLKYAVPILQHHGVRATIFCTTAYLDGTVMWNDATIEALRAWPDDDIDWREYELGLHVGRGERPQLAPTILNQLKYREQNERDEIAAKLAQQAGANTAHLMLNPDGVRALTAQGMEVGGHTHRHPILTRLDSQTANREIADNKTQLESLLDAEVVSFAYPNGRPGRDFAREHTEMVAAAGYRSALTTAPGTATAAQDPFELPRFTPWERDCGRFMARMLQNYFRSPTDSAHTT